MFGMTEPKAQWRLTSKVSAPKNLLQCEPPLFRCSGGRSPRSSSGGRRSRGGKGVAIERTATCRS